MKAQFPSAFLFLFFWNNTVGHPIDVPMVIPYIEALVPPLVCGLHNWMRARCAYVVMGGEPRGLGDSDLRNPRATLRYRSQVWSQLLPVLLAVCLLLSHLHWQPQAVSTSHVIIMLGAWYCFIFAMFFKANLDSSSVGGGQELSSWSLVPGRR
jgi:TRAP-type uncharacterized transport system fused permease subunit